MTDQNPNSTNSLAQVRRNCDVLVIGAGSKTKYVPLAANAALALLLTGCIAPDVSPKTTNATPVAVAIGTPARTQIRGTAIDGTIVDMGTLDVVR